MGVQDGFPVSASYTNPRYISKNTPDVMPFPLGFTGSGAAIADIQAAVNKLYTASGASESTTGTVYNATPGTVANGDSYEDAITILADKFDAATGHMHSGSAGEGPVLDVVLSAAVSGTGGTPVTGNITFEAGVGMEINQFGDNFIFNAASGGGAAITVSASGYSPLTGDVVFVAGTGGVSITQVGQNIIIEAGGGGDPAEPPTVQKFLSGSGTYTTPTSPAPLYLIVEMVGGGGGGSGSSARASADGGAGGTGGNTTFGTTLLVANGGVGGAGGGGTAGGVGGSASLGTGPLGIALSGGQGGASSVGSNSGGNALLVSGGGAVSPFGGAGPSTIVGAAGVAAIANTGSGGSGGGDNGGNSTGSGGGAGGYVKALITSVSGSYPYAVGAAGTAGTAGTSGFAGGAGALGVIVVTEVYAASGGGGSSGTSATASYDAQNLGIGAAVGSNILTVNITQSDGSAPSIGTGAVPIAFRTDTLTAGTYEQVLVTSPTSIATIVGASFGKSTGIDSFLYVYSINNNGTAEAALAGTCDFDEGALYNTTAISSGSQSDNVLYSTTARTGVAVRLLGRLTINQSGTGVYTSSPSAVALLPFNKSSSTLAYYAGYMPTAAVWDDTSSSFTDGTNAGGNALTDRVVNGIAVTAAAGNVAGITWTPPSDTATYRITAIFSSYTFTAVTPANHRMIDNNSVEIVRGSWQQSGTAVTVACMNLTGIYTPGTTSPVTVRLQGASGTGGGAHWFIESIGLANSIEWTVEQINPTLGSPSPAPSFQGLGTVTTFVADGTFTTPASSSAATIYEYLIQGTGGGGGGSAGAGSAGSGGGAGATAMGTFTGIAPGTGIAVTIGTGGAGGNNANGSQGGDTTLDLPGNTITCGSGNAGLVGSIGSGRAGGGGGSVTAGTPDFSYDGGGGDAGISDNAIFISGGQGGASYFGGAAANVAGSTQPANSTAPGAGGTGAGGSPGGSPGRGGTGGPGLIIIKQLTP